MSRRLLATSFLSVVIIGLSVLRVSNQTRDVKSPQSVTTPRELLQTYKRLYNLSPSERRELFNKASAQEKSDLWRFHLASALAGRSSLERQQQEVVLQAISLATPQLFGVSKSDPLWPQLVDEPLQRLTRQALGVFSKEQAKIFATLGKPIPPPPPAATSLSVFVKTSQDFLPSCSCSTHSDWCNTVCTGTGSCEHSDSGCGFLWMYDCNGQCYKYGFIC